MTVERGKLVIRLTKAEPDFLSAIPYACVLPAGLARIGGRPEGIGPRSRAQAPTSSPSTSPASGSCSSATASTVEPAYTTSTGSR